MHYTIRLLLLLLFSIDKHTLNCVSTKVLKSYHLPDYNRVAVMYLSLTDKPLLNTKFQRYKMVAPEPFIRACRLRQST